MKTTTDVTSTGEASKIAVVIPCYRVSKHIEEVLSKIGPEVTRIYCVDDACPENSWKLIENIRKSDPRIDLIRHEKNQGVGGAVLSGYQKAYKDRMDIVVKIDGDGQMDPTKIRLVALPLLENRADYAKGNRFYNLEHLDQMPSIRKFGNIGLSFLAKLSTGYWNIFDPTNGFTAIRAEIIGELPLDKISRRYLFETDILFRLNCVRAVTVDVPLAPYYGEEESNLNPFLELPRHFAKHMKNTVKRIFYNYFLRDFNVASINATIGTALILFGIIFGTYNWATNISIGRLTSPGTVMLAALPIILGTQLLLSFLSFDLSNIPRNPIHIFLPNRNQDNETDGK
jgi:dolichol-phosphate mannosyltransferase